MTLYIKFCPAQKTQDTKKTQAVDARFIGATLKSKMLIEGCDGVTVVGLHRVYVIVCSNKI